MMTWLDITFKLTTDTDKFKQLLKSYLFHIAFWHFVNTSGQFVIPNLYLYGVQWYQFGRGSLPEEGKLHTKNHEESTSLYFSLDVTWILLFYWKIMA